MDVEGFVASRRAGNAQDRGSRPGLALYTQSERPIAPARQDANRFRLLGVLIFGLLLLGLATLNGALLVLAVPLIVYLGAAMLRRPDVVRLEIARTLSTSRAFQDTPVSIGLSITNRGTHLEDVLVEDLSLPLPVLDGERSMLTSLSPGETVEMAYTVRGRRGVFDFEDVRVTASERLGIFERQIRVPAPGQLTILPRVLQLSRVAIRPLRTRGFAGPIPARRGGSGTEFFGVREYQPGDPQRWINWRVGARHPHTLFTNEFEQTRIADVGLILDARQRSNVQVGDDSLFEHAVRATASLAEVFVNDGNRVGLLIYGWFLNWVFAGYGKIQRERILRALAQAGTGESVVFGDLDRLPTRSFPARSQIVLVSPLFRDDVPTLLRLRARGYQLLIISPDPISFELGGSSPQPDVALAARIARLERALLFRRLRQAGIQTIDWQVDRRFDRVVHASLGRLPPWFRALGLEQ